MNSKKVNIETNVEKILRTFRINSPRIRKIGIENVIKDVDGLSVDYIGITEYFVTNVSGVEYGRRLELPRTLENIKAAKALSNIVMLEEDFIKRGIVNIKNFEFLGSIDSTIVEPSLMFTVETYGEAVRYIKEIGNSLKTIENLLMPASSTLPPIIFETEIVSLVSKNPNGEFCDFLEQDYTLNDKFLRDVYVANKIKELEPEVMEVLTKRNSSRYRLNVYYKTNLAGQRKKVLSSTFEVACITDVTKVGGVKVKGNTSIDALEGIRSALEALVADSMYSNVTSSATGGLIDSAVITPTNNHFEIQIDSVNTVLLTYVDATIKNTSTNEELAKDLFSCIFTSHTEEGSVNAQVTASFMIYTLPANGEYTVTVVSKDVRGNIFETSVNITVETPAVEPEPSTPVKEVKEETTSDPEVDNLKPAKKK